MENKYPHFEIYEKIYKKYFNRSPKELIKLANLNVCDTAIDLCGGNGRLTFELFKQKVIPIYVDKENDMIPKEKLEAKNILYINESVEEFLDDFNDKVNVIFCQQAINYWFNTVDISKLVKFLKPNGKFIFNTFNKKPLITPMTKQYVIDDLHYIEISYLVNNKVYHVQCCEGYEPHFTIFDWISREQFIEKLEPYFKVKEIVDKNTSIYVCEKRMD